MSIRTNEAYKKLFGRATKKKRQNRLIRVYWVDFKMVLDVTEKPKETK